MRATQVLDFLMNTQERWDNIFNEGKDFRPMNQILLDRVLDFIKKSNTYPKNALDIGCGTGDLVVKLARAGFETTGIDISKVALQKADLRTHEAGTGAVFHQLDITDPTFLKTFVHPIELIFCKLVYAFIPNKNAFLDAVKSVLSENGFFVLITPVLYEGVEYDKRLMGISVNYKETLLSLQQHFTSVTIFNESFTDEKESLITFIAKK